MSVLTENQILSKVIDEDSVYLLDKFKLGERDFVAQGDVYNFIKGYAKQYGQAPDYTTVVAKFDNFDYQPEVVSNIKYMAKEIKSDTAKRDMYMLLQKDTPENFEKMTGKDFANWIEERVKGIADEVNRCDTQGTDVSKNGNERKKIYEDNKLNRSDRFIPTPYPTMNIWTGGGFELGDYVLLMAYTNKGKSWIAVDVGRTAWTAGFGVLHYAPELSKAQMVQRFDTFQGQFDNTKLKLGELDEGEEADYFEYLADFKENNDSKPYIIKTMEDLPDGLSLKVIEADLAESPDIDMIIIDGFNLMQHEGRGSNRDAMTNTSRELRQLFARHEVAGIVVHQTPTSAEKDAQGKEFDEEDNRIIKAPEVTDYSETIAVVQDACTAITFNQRDGIGKLKLGKARTPHVGKELEVFCDFNKGRVIESVPVSVTDIF